MAPWEKGEQTVRYLVSESRLESFEADDFASLAEAMIGRAALRVETTAAAALKGRDVDGSYVAASGSHVFPRRFASQLLEVRIGRGRRTLSPTDLPVMMRASLAWAGSEPPRRSAGNSS